MYEFVKLLRVFLQLFLGLVDALFHLVDSEIEVDGYLLVEYKRISGDLVCFGF